MIIDQSHLHFLLQQYADDACSKEQMEELFAYIRMVEKNDTNLSDALLQSWEAIKLEDWHASISADMKPAPVPSVNRIYFLKKSWFRYAAAIIIMLGVAGYLWFNNTTSNPINSTNPTNPNSDITPGGDKAILTLADGRQIMLDNKQGNVVQQGNLKVINQQGKLDYEGLSTNVEYHTLSTPKGGQYKIQLPDGTNVWLNAASSITYPTVFAGKDRKVNITGEAYFEVRKDAHKPFTVKTYKDEIVVLGTSFNVNSYNNEPAIRTSLLEGAVRVNDKVLKPGEEYRNGEVVPADLERDLAWKNGTFNFRNADLQSVMRQLERWYDIKVVYEKGVSERYKFQGKLDRNLALSEVLWILEKMEVKFRLEGRQLTVIK